jgi:metal-responsive CopG/Arc/MetJ family transcriptional regulator
MAAKILISLPQEFLDNVDRAAAEEHRSRSELVREALRSYLETRQERKGRVQAIAEQPAVYQGAAVEMPGKPLDLNARREAFKVVEKLRAQNAQYSPEEIEKDVAEAIREVRAKRRAERGG